MIKEANLDSLHTDVAEEHADAGLYAITKEKAEMATTQQRERKPRKGGFAGAHLAGDNFGYDIEVKNAEAIKLYDKWKETDSKEDFDEFVLFLCRLLKNMSKDHMGIYHFSDKDLGSDPEHYGSIDFVSGEREVEQDLLQETYLAIATFAKTYNPHESMPSSYFGVRIDEYMRKSVERNPGASQHYRENRVKLDRIATQNGYEGAADPRLTVELLHLMSGISLETIVNTMSTTSLTSVSYDETDKDGNNMYDSLPDAHVPTPEQELIRNETNSYLAAAWNTLSRYEQFIFTKSCLEQKKDKDGMDEFDKFGRPKFASAKAIREMLDNPEILRHFELDSLPDSNRIQRDVEIARRKLYHYGDIRKRFRYVVEAKREGIKSYEQADMDDLEVAILSDIQTR